MSKRATTASPVRDTSSVQATLDQELIERYERAAELERFVEAEWVRSGRPITLVYNGSQTGQHPLYKAVLEARKQAAAMATPLKRRRSGPQPSAVPSIRKASSARLRSVG